MSQQPSRLIQMVYHARHKGKKSGWGGLRCECKAEMGTTLFKGLREKGLERNTVLSLI